MAARKRARKRPEGWVHRLSPFFLVIGLAAIGWMVYKLGPHTIWQNLLRVSWGFLIACSIHLCGLILDSLMLRFCTGLSARRLPFRPVLHAVMAGHAINEATPLNQLGELTKYNMLDEKLPATKAAAALILQNLMRFVINCCLLAVLPPLAIVLLDLGSPLAPILLTMSGVFVIAGALALLLINRGGGEWPFRLLRRFYGKRRTDRLRARWKKVEQAWQQRADDRSGMVLTIVFGVAARSCSLIEMGVILTFLDQPHPFFIAFLVQPTLSVIYSVFSFIPFQAGAGEGTAYILFRAALLPPHVGVVMELIRKVRRLVFVLIGVTMIGLKSYRQLMVEREAAAEG